VKSGALVIKRGGFPGTAHDLSAPETLIGRHPATDITLVDEGVSREHAVVTMDDDGFAIEDLQSTNGTKLNGKRVRSARLRDGDEIQIGGTLFVFRFS
jgi:pSer/pThr/pTyr-binding forkhead associated (FHA) protein